jgi:predicted lipoprotein
MELTQPRSPMRLRLIAGALLAVLVVAMALNTKFLSPAEVAAIAPKPFDPVQTAADLWSRAQSELPGQAAPLGQVVPAMQSDLKGAAGTYKAVSPNEGAYIFPVSVDGTVVEATDASLRLQVAGVPAATPVVVPLGTGLNGTVVRDLMGFKFAQAPGQTDFQYVGDELRKLMQAEVQSLGSPAALQGKQVKVVGAVNVIATGNTVPPAKPVTVQPISIEAT